MRIISKFNDYYDGGQGYGIDPNLVYVRKTEEYTRKDKHSFSAFPEKLYQLIPDPFYERTLRHHFPKMHMMSAGYIGFCGKVHFFVKIEYYSRKYSLGTQAHTFYSLEELREHFKKKRTYKAFSKEILKEDKKNKRFLRHWSHYDWDTRSLTERFNEQFADAQSFFIDQKVPIFLIETLTNPYYGSARLVLNPCLKDYEFYKVSDPFNTFQEISMFIGGVIPQDGPEMATISDENLKSMKGHGDKYSFKTPPTKKKVNK